MTDPLTVFGELTSNAWTQDRDIRWNLTTENGQALYWEWVAPAGRECSPEDFLVFTRTIFPNGGCVCQANSNHALVWKINEGDSYGIGIRKLHQNAVWVVAIVETGEVYPGSSSASDRALNLKAARFVAEEFLRGTEALDIFKCEKVIVDESDSWWKYLQTLERVINWKFPEVKIFTRKATARTEQETRSSRWQRYDRKWDNKKWDDKEWGNQKWDDTKWDEKGSSWRSRDVSPARAWSRHNSGQSSPRNNAYDRAQVRRRSRSRSPHRFTTVRKSQQDHAPSGAINKPKLCCKTCDLYFEHSYELMRHYNSDVHQSALLKEFPM